MMARSIEVVDFEFAEQASEVIVNATNSTW